MRETVVTRPTTLYHLTIEAADGSIETLGTTAEHPFFVPSRGDFIRAGDLREGDDLAQADGSTARLVAIRVERAAPGQAFTTYNFEVAEFHTYHVGRSGVWVHNAGFFNCDAALDVFQKGGVDALVDYIRKGNFEDVGDALKQLGKSLDADDLAKVKTKLLEGFDFGKYLRGLIGDPPNGMVDPHAHHILFKTGLGPAQQALVDEGQAILRKVGIDPIFGKENLIWAPWRVSKQHGLDSLKKVVDKLRDLEAAGADYNAFVAALKRLGNEAARRT